MAAGAAALNTVTCDRTYGVHRNVVIPPKTNGYFTLPSIPCDQRGQVDMFFGSDVRECRSPDFASERVYTGQTCEPPVVVCADPGWGPWVTVNAPATRCTTQRRERTLCNGQKDTEFRQVCT